MKKEIIRILMKRDGMTEQEANDLFEETQEAFNELVEEGSYDEAENIMADYLGLEPDYMEAFLGL